MSITVNLYYTGKNGNARKFAEEMESSGIAAAVRAQEGNEKYDAGNAWRIYLRDRGKHASPNSAQTESVCAGALKVRLAGPAYYFGKKVEKPFIGDDLRKIERGDIKKANLMMLVTSFLIAIAVIELRVVLCLK